MPRRLAGDWLDMHGHPMLLAGTFCDPQRFSGTLCRAAGWEKLGDPRASPAPTGAIPTPTVQPREPFVRPLRRDARTLLSNPQPLPAQVVPPADPALAPRNPATIRSLHAELDTMPDFRQPQARKQTVACALTLHILAEIENMNGCIAAAQFGQSLTRKEPEAIGAWKNPKTGLREPVSRSILHRVVQGFSGGWPEGAGKEQGSDGRT